MNKALKFTILFAILVAPVLWGLFWKYGKVSYTKLPVLGEVEMTGDTTPFLIPNFSFIDQNGDSVTQKTFENKIYVANFFFATCPDVCPRMNRNLHLVYEKFKRHPDVMFLSHTVHPEHDTIEVLKEYSTKMHVDDSKWHFVTGRKLDIYNLAEKSYKAVTVTGDQPSTFIHSEILVLVDKEKHIRGFYDSQDFEDIKQLQDAIVILLKEYDDKK